MTSRERMDAAMHPRQRQRPDRIPVMCQLALGHYFLHAEGGPIDIWHDSEAFAAALLLLQDRYGFDGILVNLPGRDPAWRRGIRHIERRDRVQLVHWTNGKVTLAPDDDNPHVVAEGKRKPALARFAEIDVDQLHYVEPHDSAGVVNLPEFPPWHWDTIRIVRERAPAVSLHGEVFSPLSQLMELVGPTEGALALALDHRKVHAAFERLAAGAVELALGHAEAGADAVLISSAYAGAGFISPAHYRTFVLPYERTMVDRVKARFPTLPVYTHTCGAIGDRLELMAATGTDGIDTLDPPPLGNVDLADARRRLGSGLFIKGNVDPVNTILRGTPEGCYRDARERIRIAAAHGGYILSTACSVPPHAPPENILALARAASDAATGT